MIPEMEPTLTTDPELTEILAELVCREPIFHRPELGVTRADFENMTVADFWEVGASGRRYGRAYVLDQLEKRHAVPHIDIWETTDSHCRRLAHDVYLLTYTLLQNKSAEHVGRLFGSARSKDGRSCSIREQLFRTLDGGECCLNSDRHLTRRSQTMLS
jgi:hypothetical protein